MAGQFNMPRITFLTERSPFFVFTLINLEKKRQFNQSVYRKLNVGRDHSFE